MSILIKGLEIPQSCYDCKLDLRSDVCSAFCEWNAEHPYSIRATDRLPGCPLSEVPECEDAVPRTSIEYICQKNTVSTNPYEHKYHDKFIKFMDDPEISDFGRWQHSNGFNTALVAVKCDLDKVPSIEPERKTGKWIERNPQNSDKCRLIECDQCGFAHIVGFNVPYEHWIENRNFCERCGADMRKKGEK